ncbi:MAG: hypothetical protein ACTHKU_16940 [Verrucomicrobiota bacterium]
MFGIDVALNDSLLVRHTGHALYLSAAAVVFDAGVVEVLLLREVQPRAQ